ncbi:MAG: ATP-grasp domain-containing protein [Cyanobacteria bacterium J06621_12]
MELLEYQAKELFRMVGIPILPSLTIQDARKIKQLQIPYPVVLKSQVRSGGRGKAGGVRFVANTIDAIAAARSIFNLSILGEYPEVILAEAHYDTERELFLAIVLDYDLQCPVLLGSAWGGMNIDSLLSNLQQVAVEEGFSLFYARRLAAKMGLSGKLIASVSDVVAKMYRLFQEQDLDLIEINPLGINNRGELMALDGRVTINDYALARQPIIETLNFSAQQRAMSNDSSWTANKDFSQVRWRWLDWHHQAGKVAMICSSFDAALLTWDLLQQNEVVPACSALIENSLDSQTDSLHLYREQLLAILQKLEAFIGIEAIILNIWDTEAISQEIIQTIVDYCAAKTAKVASSLPSEQILVNSAIALSESYEPESSSLIASNPPKVIPAAPYFVLRLPNQSNLADLELPDSEQIYLSGSLEDSINQTIAIIKSN